MEIVILLELLLLLVAYLQFKYKGYNVKEDAEVLVLGLCLAFLLSVVGLIVFAIFLHVHKKRRERE